jgi:hypothetical protein
MGYELPESKIFLQSGSIFANVRARRVHLSRTEWFFTADRFSPVPPRTTCKTASTEVFCKGESEMGLFQMSDKGFAKEAEAAGNRALSGQTPASWLPGFVKRGFTNSAGQHNDAKAVNYSMGLQHGMLLGAAVFSMAQERLGLAALFLTVAIGADIFHQNRGKNLKSPVPENKPN